MAQTDNFWSRLFDLLQEPGRFEMLPGFGLAAFVVVVLAIVLILREVRNLRIRLK